MGFPIKRSGMKEHAFLRVLFCSVFYFKNIFRVLFCSMFYRTDRTLLFRTRMFCVLSSLVGNITVDLPSSWINGPTCWINDSWKYRIGNIAKSREVQVQLETSFDISDLSPTVTGVFQLQSKLFKALTQKSF